MGPYAAVPAQIPRPAQGSCAGANVRRYLLNNLLRSSSCFGIACGGLNLIVLQVMEDQPRRIPFEYFGGPRWRRCSTAKSLRASNSFSRFPGFVIDDFYVRSGPARSPDRFRPVMMTLFSIGQFERFFLLQNLRQAFPAWLHKIPLTVPRHPFCIRFSWYRLRSPLIFHSVSKIRCTSSNGSLACPRRSSASVLRTVS